MDKVVEMAIMKYPRFAERRIGFIDGYQQAKKDTLDTVSDWLRKNIQDYLFISNGEPHIPINGVIEIMRGTINEEE